jgi:hypothetical protein
MLTALGIALVIFGLVVLVWDANRARLDRLGRRLLSALRAGATIRREWTGFVQSIRLQLHWNKRAQAYLMRIVELTGAKKIDGCYMLDTGGTQFYVSDRQVRRAEKNGRALLARTQTCFYIPQQTMPAEEKIATVLLHLKNNPALFELWARQCGTFKADGEMFSLLY